jgi:uncharacterized protein (DUF433 family)
MSLVRFSVVSHRDTLRYMANGRPVSFRLDEELFGHLERRARDLGTNRTALAERYLREGLRVDEHPLIAFRDGLGGRRPALVGTRLDVWQVVETVRTSGGVEEAADYLDVPAAKVRAAMRYYASFKGEVDEWAGRMRERAEAEEHAWRREQEVLS